MSLTLKKSGKKSSASLKVYSSVSSGGKFFDYYKKHNTFVDHILKARVIKINPFINEEDVKDLCQDVLVKLDRCNIIGRYAPGKSAFNTYLTNTIDGYVKCWLRDKNVNKHKVWRPWPTKKAFAKYDAGKLRYEQLYFSSINGVDSTQACDSHTDGMPVTDIPAQDNFDEQYAVREMVDLIRKNIPEELVPFMDALKDGLSKTETAERLSITFWQVVGKFEVVRKYAERILKDR